MKKPTKAQRAAAHAVLDLARAGGDVPQCQITKAMHITGDLTDAEFMAEAPQQIHRPAGTWGWKHAGQAARASWLDPIH